MIGHYADLAARGAHLLDEILTDNPPRQWAHYPDDDVICGDGVFQYFYHSHSPEDRGPTAEHGHFHLFARDRVQHPSAGEAIALLCISLNPTGVPIGLFTVNRWVTGGQLLSAAASMVLLKRFVALAHPSGSIGQWMSALLDMYEGDIDELLHQRDRQLLELVLRDGQRNWLDDDSIDVLSHMDIDIDARLQLLTTLQAKL